MTMALYKKYFLRIRSHLLKKLSMEGFVFGAAQSMFV